MPSENNNRHVFKIPVLRLLNIFRKYKTGALSTSGAIIALILLFIGVAACTQEDTEGCIRWTAYWEASNR